MTTIEASYGERLESFLKPIAVHLEAHLAQCLEGCQRKDRVCARAKSVESFMRKAGMTADGTARYSDPLNQIQDQIGARVVTYFLKDVEPIAAMVQRYFHPIENELHVPDSDSEFGYIGQHFILLLPSDITAGFEGNDVPEFFELQIKTLFQHAWAEAEHDLGYKPAEPLTSLQRRKIAFTAAQAWGADLIFDELSQGLKQELPTL